MAVQQQRIGGDQQNLEEHEEIEQIAGEERTIDAQQLELVQRMEVRPALVIAAAGVERGETGQHGGDQQHQRAQAIEHQDDAEWRLPVAQRIGAQLAVTREQQQPEGDRHQRPGGRQRKQALGRLAQAVEQQQRRAREQRQEDRQDQGMLHLLGSCPSTWSVRSSPMLRSASTTTKAVMAKPMTMAVSTSACGSGSP